MEWHVDPDVVFVLLDGSCYSFGLWLRVSGGSLKYCVTKIYHENHTTDPVCLGAGVGGGCSQSESNDIPVPVEIHSWAWWSWRRRSPVLPPHPVVGVRILVTIRVQQWSNIPVNWLHQRLSENILETICSICLHFPLLCMQAPTSQCLQSNASKVVQISILKTTFLDSLDIASVVLSSLEDSDQLVQEIWCSGGSNPLSSMNTSVNPDCSGVWAPGRGSYLHQVDLATLVWWAHVGEGHEAGVVCGKLLHPWDDCVISVKISQSFSII